MDKYTVKIYAGAYRDLDNIYTHIAENLSEPTTALHLIDELETAIFSLEQLPERGAVRRVGAYANSSYNQVYYVRCRRDAGGYAQLKKTFTLYIFVL